MEQLDAKTDDGNRSREEAPKGEPELALGHLAPESVSQLNVILGLRSDRASKGPAGETWE